jgi:hypothetical protein
MTMPRRLGVLSLVILVGAGGCHCLSGHDSAPAEPPAARCEEGGLLLKTGAIQLGPGVGKNAWRWQGDGEWGF